MINKLRQLILLMNERGGKFSTQREIHKFFQNVAFSVRKPKFFETALTGFNETIRKHEVETSSWVGHETLKKGESGPFDACDLRNWLALSERAGVPFVPAEEILSLTEDEYSAACGKIDLGSSSLVKGITKRLGKYAESDQFEGDFEQVVSLLSDRSVDAEQLREKLFSCMDDVPDGWMVRSVYCASSNIKSLAGCGLAGPTSPETKFENIEIGPGWHRTGNRRVVTINDERIMKSVAASPNIPKSFVARPWIESDRYVIGEDPHRHGSQFAGKGMWPAEWRAFVEKGEVVGVSFYYGWCGEATRENAEMALEVRRLAQMIVDESKKSKNYPRFMDLEFLRENKNASEIMKRFPRDDIACTLDFMESKDGLVLLEGGPPHTPFGGGHPCAFAGCGGKPKFGHSIETNGVAFKLMPHVDMGNPDTWDDGDRSGCILTWDEVELLRSERSYSV